MNCKIIAGIIALIAVLILGIIGAKVYSYSKIEVVGIDSASIEGIGLEGFTAKGDILIYNRGITSVSIENITYNITLESTGRLLSQGYVEGNSIPAKEAERFGFTSEISWSPSADTAVELVTSEEVFVVISGKANVDAIITDISLPFERKIDIRPYIVQFAQERIEEGMGRFIEGLEGILG